MEAKFKLEFVTVLAYCLVVWDEGSLPKFYGERSDPKQLVVKPQCKMQMSEEILLLWL